MPVVVPLLSVVRRRAAEGVARSTAERRLLVAFRTCAPRAQAAAIAFVERCGAPAVADPVTQQPAPASARPPR